MAIDLSVRNCEIKSFKTGSLEVTIIDYNLAGHLDLKGNTFSFEDTLSEIKKLVVNKDTKIISELFTRIIGGCCLIIEDLESYFIINSSTFPGIYYNYSESFDLKIWMDETNALDKPVKELDPVGLAGATMFHQGLIRDGYNTLKKSVKYLPSGCSISFSGKGIVMNFYFSQFKKIKNLEFSELVESIISVYAAKHSNLKVAKSGGIDSAVLSTAYSKLSIDNKELIHIPYFGTNTPGYKTACEIGLKLNVKVSLAQKIKSSRDNLKEGLGVSIGKEYESFGFDYLTTTYEVPKIITGQNLDSLYVIDSFAPSSNEQGMIRYLKIFFSAWKRLLYTSEFMRICSKSNTLRKSYEGSFLNGYNEHRKPLIEKDKAQKSNEWEKQLFKIRQESYHQYLIEDELSLNKKVRSLKYLKFVQNTHRNYYNKLNESGVMRLTPFSEGPFLLYFLEYKLGIKDCFFIKRECSDYLKKHNLNFNKLASLHSKSSFYYFLRELFFLLPTNLSFFLSKKLKLKNADIYFPNLLIEEKKILTEFISILKSNESNIISYGLGLDLEKLSNKNSLTKQEHMKIFRIKGLMKLIND